METYRCIRFKSALKDLLVASVVGAAALGHDNHEIDQFADSFLVEAIKKN